MKANKFADLTFHSADSVADLTALRGEIEAFLTGFPESFFYSPSWLIPFQEVLAAHQTVEHIIARDDAGRLRGVAHFTVVKTPFLKLFRPKVLALLGTRSVVSPEHLEIPFAPESREAWFQFLEQYINKGAGSWAFAVFDSVAEHAVNFVACMEYLQTKGFRVIHQEQDICPYLDLPATFDDLLERYSANMRKIVRRTLRRDAGTCRLIDFTELGGIDRALQEARRLHNLARTKKGDTGSFDRDGYVDFHRALARSIHDRSELYIKFLVLGDELIAFRYGFIEDGVYYDYQTGYDPAHAERRPGFVMVAMILQDLIAHGVKRFDFLRGDEPYKRHWADKDRKTSRYFVFPPGFMASVYYTAWRFYHGWK